MLSTDYTGLKAVTFDLWETLLFERDGSNTMRTAARCENVAKALSKFGLNVSLNQTSSALDQTIDSLLKVWDRNRDVTHLDQLCYVVKYASNGEVKLKDEWIPELSSAYISPIFETPPYINPDTVKVLQWLNNQKKHIGIICNTGLTPGFGLRKLLTQEGIAEYFDTMVFSDEVCVRKPDPKIFQLAARKLETKPNETVHIGDNLKTDIHGAKNAGFKAIHLASEEGRDNKAQNDPTSLAFRSRNLGKIDTQQLAPDKTISSLNMIPKTIKELDTQKNKKRP